MERYSIGDILPDVSANDSDGITRQISAHMGERGLLLFVLRGTWCSICLAQMRTVQRNYKHYQELGVQSVFLSPEDETAIFSYQVSLPRPPAYTLYADPEKKTIQLLLNPDDIGVLPATYLLDTERRVMWVHRGQHAEDRPTHANLLAAIEAHLSVRHSAYTNPT